jgi:hypothetical protein
MKKDKDKDPLIRKSVSLRESVWNAVRQLMEEENLGSEAEAIRRMITEYLKSTKGKA